MSNISTRRAVVQDSGVLAALFDGYRQFYQMPADAQRAEAYIQARIERSESVIFLAEDSSGEVIGFCQLYPTFCSVSMAPTYVLYDLFVKSHARRSGGGRALLAAAESHAAADGAARMYLRTAKTNGPAQTLYEASGWQRDELFYSYSKVPRP